MKNQKNKCRSRHVQEVLNKMGGQNRTALLLKINSQAISQWRDSIPPKSGLMIYIYLTCHNIEIHLEEIFPELYVDAEILGLIAELGIKSKGV